MTATETDIRICGRPTKNGSPCKNPLHHRSEVACAKHATPNDEAVRDAYRRGHEDARSQAKRWHDSEFESQKAEILRLKAEIEVFRCAEADAADARDRYYSRDGGQAVECGRYAYLWRGYPPLEVGEDVLLPPSWVPGSSSYVLTVTKLGATYEGPLVNIISRYPPA